VPILGVLFCGYLMLSLPDVTWIRFFIWLAVGMVIYFTYGRHHSRVSAVGNGAAQVDQSTA
jgi:basic amino acid/polyamine antiporter, APA family